MSAHLLAQLLSRRASAQPPAQQPQPQPLATSDPAVEQMRPQGTRTIIGVYEVGPGQTYETVAAATAAATAAQTAAASAAGRSAITPDEWVAFLVYPGTYTEIGGGVPWASWHGMGATPNAVRFVGTWTPRTGPDDSRQWDTSGSFGTACYIENLSIVVEEHDINQFVPPKYPYHGGLFPHVPTIFVNCRVGSEVTTAYANWGRTDVYGSTFGVDGNSDATFILYGCEVFTSAGLDAPYISNPTPNSGAGCDYVFVKSSVGAMLQVPGGPGAHAWLVDPVAGPGQFQQVGGNSGTTGHAPPGTPASFTTVDNRTDWPVPVGAIPPREQSYYWPV